VAQLTKDAVGVDMLWTLNSAFLVFFMQLGFGMLEAGSLRPQHTVNILVKNIVDTAISIIFYALLGFPLAHGRSGNDFIGGAGYFWLDGIDHALLAYFLYNWAFSATTSTIVSGCVAERTAFISYILYVIYDTAVINPPIVHWMWDAHGWLSPFRAEPYAKPEWPLGVPAIDFAGSGVVHLSGSVCVCVCVCVFPSLRNSPVLRTLLLHPQLSSSASLPAPISQPICLLVDAWRSSTTTARVNKRMATLHYSQLVIDQDSARALRVLVMFAAFRYVCGVNHRWNHAKHRGR